MLSNYYTWRLIIPPPEAVPSRPTTHASLFVRDGFIMGSSPSNIKAYTLCSEEGKLLEEYRLEFPDTVERLTLEEASHED